MSSVPASPYLLKDWTPIFLTAPNNLALGTAAALQDETFSFTLPFALTTPTTFADALTVAQADVVQVRTTSPLFQFSVATGRILL